jgi:4-amino-4-deoxy-L-arabinose transferase-like glycosyltransferase
MDRMWSGRLFWGVLVVLLLSTQVVAAARFLSIDNVNLAFALEYFDPLNHQPQPPGYPFFVLFGRILNYVFGNAETTFLFISVIACGIALVTLTALGKRMFSDWVGRAAAFLLLVNPVFWQGGVTSPLRPFLALFSLLTAYCAWRCWNGEARYALWGAVCLGIGSGFRPELLAILFPIWLWTAWAGSRSFKTVAAGILVMAGFVLIWVGALASAIGGVQAMAKLLGDYLVDQSRAESLVMGADPRAWLRQTARIGIWNLTAVFWWIWALPFLFRRGGPSLDKRATVFAAVWIFPGLVLQAMIHGAAPGHTLFSIPALCLVGAHVVAAVGKRFEVAVDSFQWRETWISAALVLSVLVFINFFPRPSSAPETSSGPSIKNVIAFALDESSLGTIRSMDDVAALTIHELRQFTPARRPSVVVTTDQARKTWFLNWRILRYYEPARQIWALDDQRSQPSALRVLRFGSLESVRGNPAPISVPKGGRILWILEPSSEFKTALDATRPLSEGRYVHYTDLPEDAVPFTVAGFEFRPQ